jgi:L-lactate dehydrogenase
MAAVDRRRHRPRLGERGLLGPRTVEDPRHKAYRYQYLREAGMKIGIIGAGAVGAATVGNLIQPGGVSPEIILIDRDRKKAAGLAEDFSYAAALDSLATVRAGGYDDLGDASLVIVNAGVNEKDGGATDRSDPQGRRRLTPVNARVYADIVPRVQAAAPGTTLLTITDPPDPLAELARHLAPDLHILSAGTVIDTLRFRYRIAREFGIRACDVDATVLGEHGTSSVYLWSSARVGGVRVLDLLARRGADAAEFQERIRQAVTYSNISIIEGIGASQHGIGAVTARIAEAIVRDEHAILPVASHHEEYGTTISLPSVIGRHGVERVMCPELTDAERAGLEDSAQVLRDAAQMALDSLEDG